MNRMIDKSDLLMLFEESWEICDTRSDIKFALLTLIKFVMLPKADEFYKEIEQAFGADTTCQEFQIALIAIIQISWVEALDQANMDKVLNAFYTDNQEQLQRATAGTDLIDMVTSLQTIKLRGIIVCRVITVLHRKGAINT